MSNEELTTSNPDEPDTKPAGVMPTSPPWIKEHSFPVIVGCAAILGAIVVGIHVVLGGAMGDDSPMEHLR